MPSFSLVRRFGKQCKATINSPVSSGLVEHHVGHTVAEGSHSESWIREQSQVANGFSSFPALNSHGLSSGPVTLSPHFEGLSIRDINAPVMSNNQVNIHHYYGSRANFDGGNAGDIHLEEEIGSYLDENNVWRTRYKGKIMASSTPNISIWSYRGERAEEALEKAYKKYASLPRHPNILQLYGICHSLHLTALVFHGTLHLLYWWMYYKLLPPSQWMTRYIKLHKQYESAHSMLEAHNLRGWTLVLSDADESGKLVIGHFSPGPTDHSAFDPRICTAFETNTFIKEDLLAYYKFLFDMIDWPTNLPTSTLLSPFDKAAPFQLSHPETNFPVYSISGWNKVVNGMDITVGQTGMVLTILRNMTIRCCIPTSQIPIFSILEPIRLFEPTDITLFATWACQANHLIHDLPINIMDLQTKLSPNWSYFKCHAQSIPGWKKDTESARLNNSLETEHLYLFCPPKVAGNIYWSLDEEGQHIIEDSLIQATFGITVDWYGINNVYSIPPQCYHILPTIHKSCGFDPYSTQVAEYLGLPVAVIAGGRSGLEDSEYAEDPEYTSESESESESGVSDYVSASEDV
ncbi:hypothetical protein C8J56DRAFT_1165059 [Mycena floridula]|nr:hypothetical protein C8J56DRAFT_1165059 [Mycena floridula]